jgi:hypothetical protein
MLSAVMRLPWRDVGHRVAEDLRAGWPEQRGVLDGTRELVRALRHRRPLPEDVLADIAVLAGGVRAEPTAAGRAPCT